MNAAEEKGLLADVCANVADDTPRLIYADWLDDHGQPERAEFIRAQIELARRGCVDVWCEKIFREKYPIGRRCEMADECDALRRRERELLETMLNTSTPTRRGATQARYLWTQEVSGRNCMVWKHEFRCGFVAALALTLRDWYGGPCEGPGGEVTCRGTGSIETTNLKIPCRACSGAGRVGGHGPALVKAAPLEDVRLTDKWAQEVRSGGTADFTFVCYPDDLPTAHLADNLPRPLFDRLPAGPRRWGPNLAIFTSRAAAEAGLSAACLSWARGQK